MIFGVREANHLALEVEREASSQGAWDLMDYHDEGLSGQSG